MIMKLRYSNNCKTWPCQYVNQIRKRNARNNAETILFSEKRWKNT